MKKIALEIDLFSPNGNFCLKWPGLEKFDLANTINCNKNVKMGHRIQK